MGNSVRDCYYKNTTTLAYRSVPYPKQSTEEYRQLRKDFKQTNSRVYNANELSHNTNDETDNAEETERHDDVEDLKKLLKLRHPPQTYKSALLNQQQQTTPQTRLPTGNHTGWQSRPSTPAEETTNFVITRHSTDNYTIKPKETKRRPEVHNIQRLNPDSTPPDQPNEEKRTTSPKPNNPQKKPKYEIRQLSATLQLNRKDKLLYVRLQFHEYENFGLLDTGAIQNALSEAELRRILTAHPAVLLQELPDRS